MRKRVILKIKQIKNCFKKSNNNNQRKCLSSKTKVDQRTKKNIFNKAKLIKKS